MATQPSTVPRTPGRAKGSGAAPYPGPCSPIRSSRAFRASAYSYSRWLARTSSPMPLKLRPDAADVPAGLPHGDDGVAAAGVGVGLVGEECAPDGVGLHLHRLQLPDQPVQCRGTRQQLLELEAHPADSAPDAQAAVSRRRRKPGGAAGARRTSPRPSGPRPVRGQRHVPGVPEHHGNSIQQRVPAAAQRRRVQGQGQHGRRGRPGTATSAAPGGRGRRAPRQPHRRTAQRGQRAAGLHNCAKRTPGRRRPSRQEPPCLPAVTGLHRTARWHPTDRSSDSRPSRCLPSSYS